MDTLNTALSCWFALLIVAALQACGGPQGDTTLAPSDQVSFTKDLLPIFQKNCVSCHSGSKALSDDLSLDSYRALMAGQSGEPVVIPGNPARSEVVKVMEEARMPKIVEGFHRPLLTREISILRQWIAQGAKDN
jgi:hypothetical protein